MTGASVTRESILAMEAGDEMDLLVTARVLRWKLHARNTAHWTDEAHEHAVGNYPVLADAGPGWRPSRNVGQAMLLVEKLRQESAHVVMNTGRSDEHLPERIGNALQVEMQSYVDDIRDQSGRTWYVAFYRLGGGIVSRTDGHGWAKELPLAICRAALQATLDVEAPGVTRS